MPKEKEVRKFAAVIHENVGTTVTLNKRMVVMKNKRMHAYMILITIGCTLFLALSPPAGAADLIGLLTDQLGVTTEQAKGGAGALFDLAKQKLGADDFAKITDALPDVSTLLNSAPAVEASEAATTAKSVAGMLGQKGETGALSELSSLSGAFSSLGMKGDMVGKFAPVIVDWARSQGGEMVSQLLGKAFAI